MPPISSSGTDRAVSLVPFLYFLLTRARAPRDFAYNAATSWVPALWIAYHSGLTDPAALLASFGAGYLCFISIYEIGYLANDAWDAHRNPDGRQRLGFRPGPLYLLLFVAIRLALWAVLGVAFGWIGNPVWLAAYGALVIAFAQHNLIASAGLRAASFFQLSVLRFLIPIIGMLDRGDMTQAFLAALLFYTYFRFLSYLDSKSLLQMEVRRSDLFGLVQITMLAPLILLIAFAAGSSLLVQLLLYFTLIFAFWAAAARARRKVAP